MVAPAWITALMISMPSHIDRVARSHSANISSSPGANPNRLVLVVAVLILAGMAGARNYRLEIGRNGQPRRFLPGIQAIADHSQRENLLAVFL
jgi:hypothetical protein